MPITTIIFIYKDVLHDPNIDNFKPKPSECTCACSPFIYNPAGHDIAVDLNIISYTSLREVFDNG